MKSRKNGFSWPLHPLQYVCIVWALFLTLLYYICIELVWMQPGGRAASIAITSVALIALCTFTYSAMRCDPIDPHCTNKDLACKYKDKDAVLTLCAKCECDVLKSSRHCAYCNKCVAGRDHHCIFIGNCIGIANIKQFWGMIFAAWLYTANMVCNMAIAVALSVRDPELVLKQLRNQIYAENLATESIIAFQAVLGSAIVLGSVSLCMLTYLGIWHIAIYRAGTTSTQFSKERAILRQSKLQSSVATETKLESAASLTKGPPLKNNKDNNIKRPPAL